MKKILVMALICVSSAVSFAVPTVNFTINASYGVFLADQSTPVSAGSIALLVWSADASYITPVEGSIPLTSGSAIGSDYVLWSGTLDMDGGFSSPVSAGGYTSTTVGGNSICDGNAYLMIFANASPIAGTQYVYSSMLIGLADSTSLPPPAPDTVDIALSSSAYMGMPGLSGTVVAVPEPSSMALLAIGLGIVALRRVRRS